MRMFTLLIGAVVIVGNSVRAESSPISSHDAKIDNVHLHYLSAGIRVPYAAVAGAGDRYCSPHAGYCDWSNGDPH